MKMRMYRRALAGGLAAGWVAFFILAQACAESPPSPDERSLASGASPTASPTVTSQEEIQTFIDELNAIQAADTAELYTGRLGDFMVYSGDMPSQNRPCSDARWDAPSSESELFFTLASGDAPKMATVCEDGTAIIMWDADDRGFSVERSYFIDEQPGVFLDTPLERMALTSVAGRPAIKTWPLPELEQRAPFFAPRRMAVIERFPSGDIPGVLLYLSGTGSQEEAVAVAEYVLMQGE